MDTKAVNRPTVPGGKLACIIPLYNEEGNAAEFLPQLYAVVKELFAQVIIVAVNDGSRDNTTQEVMACCQQGVPIRYIEFARNFGKEAALTAGLDACVEEAPDAVLIMDADFQHPFATILTMVEQWRRGIDMVYGVQVNRHQSESFLKRGLKRGFYGLMSFFSSGNKFIIPKHAGDFRLFDKKVLAALASLPEKGRYMKGLYAWVGFSSMGVEFSPEQRTRGISSFSYFQLFELAIDGLTSFSVKPLRIATFFGILIAALSFSYGMWLVAEWFIYSQPIKGFTTLASALMFFSGVQLIFIGLLGEYIGRIFVEVKQRPIYIVRYDSAKSDN